MGSPQAMEVVDSTHHGGWIIVITAIGMILLLLCLALRIYFRVAYGTISGLPDYILGLAGVCYALFQPCLPQNADFSTARGIRTIMSSPLGDTTRSRDIYSASQSIRNGRFEKGQNIVPIASLWSIRHRADF